MKEQLKVFCIHGSDTDEIGGGYGIEYAIVVASSIDDALIIGGFKDGLPDGMGIDEIDMSSKGIKYMDSYYE